MGRQVFIWAIGVVLIALAFLLTDALVWRPGVTAANVRRIREGMHLREVEVVLGGPGKAIRVHNAGRDWVYAWVGGRGEVRVVFRRDDFTPNEQTQRVTEVVFRRPRQPGLLGTIGAWLGW